MNDQPLKLKLITLLILCTQLLSAQEITQTLRGTVIDKDSKMPLIGANVLILNTEPVLGTSTDVDGYFKIENVPVGRMNMIVSYLGYQDKPLNSLLLTSGKELVLNIEMEESAENLEAVVVKAELDKTQTLNEMATVSARSFSVEETSRYAASMYDPSRMAQNYAGVNMTGGSDDLFNEIIVRGNSPSGVLWRLEGIEIPNPNHFGSLGNSGGGISMLSSSTLSNSDFYTGAFPSEFGNATSAVFDLNLRNGNNEKREYSFMLGLLGIEAAAEGPFSKRSKASYLINYRYSTLGALEAIGMNPVGDIIPAFQDLSFKINIPTKGAGVFSVFGLAGANSSNFDVVADSTQWQYEDDMYGYVEKQKTGTIGLSHKLILSDRSYLKTVAIASRSQYDGEEYFLDPNDNYKKILDETSVFKDDAIRISSMYTNKLNARNTVRAGVVLSQLDFSYQFKALDDGIFKSYLDNSGDGQMLQSYVHWKHRLTDKLTFNSGLHYTYYALTKSKSIEPRVAVKWQLSPKQSLSGAIGLHSRPEHASYYFLETTNPEEPRTQPNKDLDMTKSMHAVLGYDFNFNKNLRLKVEAYYQHLYDVPVGAAAGSTNSILNVAEIWDILGAGPAINEGKGKNYGLDITVEKFFSKQYYFLATASLYNSKYTTAEGKEFNTRYNGNYQFNILGGKEFKLGKKKNNIFGINAKLIYAGGNRYTPIDLVQSNVEGYPVRDNDKRYTEKTSDYVRLDMGLSYRINRKKMTHTIMLDIQNVTNRENVGGVFYRRSDFSVGEWYQSGLFPTFNYRIEF